MSQDTEQSHSPPPPSPSLPPLDDHASAPRQAWFRRLIPVVLLGGLMQPTPLFMQSHTAIWAIRGEGQFLPAPLLLTWLTSFAAMIFCAASAVLSIIATPYWSRLGDIKGRRFALAVPIVGNLVQWASLRLKSWD